MDVTSIMDRLRSETLGDHKAAESHPFQRALGSGALPRDLFARNLSQLLHVHRALDAALTRLAPACPPIAAVVRDEQLQSTYLVDDLAMLGFDHLVDPPLPATARIVAAIEATAASDPVAVLGLHYVLEGSNNGSKFLSRVVQRAYGLSGGAGTRYMDPYGDRQRAVWAQFKADMNAVGFSRDECDRIVAAAKVMFQAISAMGDDLLARHPMPAAVSTP